MSADWLGHRHGSIDNPICRMPATLKLGVSLVIIVGTVLAPMNWTGWFFSVSLILLLTIVLSRTPPIFLLKRLLMLSPFVLGVVLVNSFQSGGRNHWPAVAAKSGLCLLTAILLSNTTPFSDMLRSLKSFRIPALLITTLALMHRYLFVLTDEAERMRRARLSRTFAPGRRFEWRSLSTVVGQLFIRASERAEHIYDAMCARGWK